MTGHAPLTNSITDVSGGNYENLVADKTPVSTTVTDTPDTTNLSLSATDYASLIREAAMASIQGGTIYDAILLKAASKAKVECLYTLNLKHFQAVGQGNLAKLIFEP